MWYFQLIIGFFACLCGWILSGTVQITPEVIDTLTTLMDILTHYILYVIRGIDLDQATRDALIPILESLLDQIREVAVMLAPSEEWLTNALFQLAQTIANFIHELLGGGGGRG